MTIKQYVINRTETALHGFFATLSKFPEDKLNWSPIGESRSAFNVAKEVASCPLWVVEILKDRKFDEAQFVGYAAVQEGWTTIEDCKAAAFENFEKMKVAINAFPEEEMEEVVVLPWYPMSCADIMDVANWNITYHFGQINYIQTQYGDFSM